MNFEEYQKSAYQFAEYEDRIYPVLGLAEEVGELTTFFAKDKRGDYMFMDEEELVRRMRAAKKEVGDVLWMLAAICTDMNWSLDQIAMENIAKLTSRKLENTIKGEGDDR